MTAQYHGLGIVLPNLDPVLLEHEESRRIFSACHKNSSFEVVNLLRIEHQATATQEKQVIDGIVVECCDGTVPSHNLVGIKPCERLLLVYDPRQDFPHDVRVLRISFPATIHQNLVAPGEPDSLCLYFEPWNAVERTWTPEKHLRRILWWLRETALGTLHRSDQPLERMYFQSHYKIILPPDFESHVSNQSEVLRLIWASPKNSGTVIRGHYVANTSQISDAAGPGLDTLVVNIPAAMSNGIERFPSTLGQLHEQLVGRGAGLLSSLADAVKKVVPSIGIQIHNPKVQHILLLLCIPVIREAGATPERTDVVGFIVQKINLANLGIKCGVATEHDGKAYVNIPIIGAEAKSIPAADAWRELTIEPADIRFGFSLKDARRASGIPEEGSNFQGVLAGVGALGSSMADLWCRMGWGSWTYIDDDILYAHNLVRHIAKDHHIGWAKVDVVAQMTELTWPTAPKPMAISAMVTDVASADVKNAITGAQLLVDATTTLEVPRDLSECDDSPRMASTFFTPSGRDSVLLLEDASRKIRLHSIEPQYYRAILNGDWGGSHLDGHHGAYWVGAGCRDLSGVLSQEIVQLHSSTLARQIRLLTARPEAQIRVWSMDYETGALICAVIPVEESKEASLGEWRVIWDEGLAQKLKNIRTKFLPNETGGIILGYIDQKRKAVHAVDVLLAPTDSVASQAEFIRGVAGVHESIERAAALTANIIEYVGEWHSHPRNSSALPSSTDVGLLASLTNTLAIDGVPALMIIVGEADISISLGKGKVA